MMERKSRAMQEKQDRDKKAYEKADATF